MSELRVCVLHEWIAHPFDKHAGAYEYGATVIEFESNKQRAL